MPTDGETGTTKLKVAFSNFANTPKLNDLKFRWFQKVDIRHFCLFNPVERVAFPNGMDVRVVPEPNWYMVTTVVIRSAVHRGTVINRITLAHRNRNSRRRTENSHTK